MKWGQLSERDGAVTGRAARGRAGGSLPRSHRSSSGQTSACVAAAGPRASGAGAIPGAGGRGLWWLWRGPAQARLQA